MNSGEELLAPGEQPTGQLCRRGRPLPHRQGQDLAATSTTTKCKAATPLPPLRYLGQLESSLLCGLPTCDTSLCSMDASFCQTRPTMRPL